MRLLDPLDPRLGPSDDLAVARAEVAAVPAGGAELEAARARILAWIDGHPDALLRRCRDAHLTSSALVVQAGTGRVALLHHTKLRRWLQPGGHADGQANLAASALREASEETGIDGLAVAVPAVDLDVHRVEPPAEGPHLHLDVRYLVVAPAGAVLRRNHESTDLRWVEAGALGDYGVDAGLQRLAAAGLAAARRLTVTA